MKTDRTITLIFVAIVAVILIGEVFVYSVDESRYSSNVVVIGGGVEYSVTSGGSDNYTILILDNGDFSANEHYYIYYDPDHKTNVESVQVPVGAKAFTTEYYVSQLKKMLDNRNISNEVLNAEELLDALENDLGHTDITTGLIVLSGALPSTIYNGTENSEVLDWLKAGGDLYWAGGLLGAYYSTHDEIVPAAGDYQSWFFGVSDCLNTGDTDRAFSDITTNDYRHSLSLMNNSVKYAVDAESLSGQTCLAIGYTESGYSSIVMTSIGDGMICVIGGDYSNNQRHDLAQIVSSGICCYTAEHPSGIAEGSVKRGTVTGRIDIVFEVGKKYVSYVYFGGYYPVYGRMQVIV